MAAAMVAAAVAVVVALAAMVAAAHIAAAFAAVVTAFHIAIAVAATVAVHMAVRLHFVHEQVANSNAIVSIVDRIVRIAIWFQVHKSHLRMSTDEYAISNLVANVCTGAEVNYFHVIMIVRSKAQPPVYRQCADLIPARKVECKVGAYANENPVAGTVSAKFVQQVQR